MWKSGKGIRKVMAKNILPFKNPLHFGKMPCKMATQHFGQENSGLWLIACNEHELIVFVQF